MVSLSQPQKKKASADDSKASTVTLQEGLSGLGQEEAWRNSKARENKSNAITMRIDALFAKRTKDTGGTCRANLMAKSSSCCDITHHDKPFTTTWFSNVRNGQTDASMVKSPLAKARYTLLCSLLDKHGV